MSKHMIQTDLFKTLAQAEGCPLLEDVLISQVECRVRPRPAKAEIQGVIMALHGSGHLAKRANEFDGENPYWMLGEKGEAHVTRMGLHTP